MEHIDIIGFIGVAASMLSFIATGKIQHRIIIIIAIALLLTYSILKPIYPFAVLMILVLAFYVFQIVKLQKSKASIILLEVEYDNNYILEFIKNYKRDIYNYFPFYEPHKLHKCFLVMRDMNLAGILIGSIAEDILTIEVDYTKPIYRDKEIGNYIFKQNPGYFKKMGIKKIVAKSFHKGHSKFLKQMGFEQTNIDNQLVFVKDLD
ncbi:MAG: hypothetical protein PHP52_02205 [Bacteroidales bacterium]|jgi:Ca2+/Na+ antiporter|nr:hypothetical protein [Bacteroidales bacterium]MDD4216021.1 hypothetical protein [Bacteroidales bacterium]MDY0140288.1 hypothetical protein [Bacteroidales bacterium]